VTTHHDTVAHQHPTPEGHATPVTQPDELPATCAIGQHHARRLVDRLLICHRHHRQLADTVADLERLYASLDDELIRNPGAGAPSAVTGSPAPGRTDVWSLTDLRTTAYAPIAEGPACAGPCWHETCSARRRFPTDDEHGARTTRYVSVLGVLLVWSDRIRDEHPRLQPRPGARVVRRPGSGLGPFHNGTCGHDSCTALRAYERVTPHFSTERNVIGRNLDWACAQPWVGEMWTELRGLWSLLRDVALGERPPRPAAQCHVLRPDSKPCGGGIWVHANRGRCDRCGTTWTGRDFLRLSLIISPSAPATDGSITA
jgi:hypothetical protein